MIADTKKWLAEQLTKYDFLQYNCIKSKVDTKHIRLTHEQRLAILHFMLLKDFDDSEIHDFFRTIFDRKMIQDYEKGITSAQIRSGKEYLLKDGKPHPCKPIEHENGHVSVPLFQLFNFNSNDCKNCIRKKNQKKKNKFLQTQTGQLKMNMSYVLEVLNKHKYICPVDTEEVLIYEEPIYKPAKATIHKILELEYGEFLNRSFVEESYAHLQRANYLEREEINKFFNSIPLKNGMFNLAPEILEKHTPENLITYCYNVEYDLKAKCPKWKKFVSEVMSKEDIPRLQEIMGYCLLPSMPFHKIFWFYGVGRNGKSKIVSTLEAILGEENCSQLNLSEFSEGRRFSLCQLYGKLLNISSEPKLSKYGLQTNVLKMISGEDTLYAELKGKNKRLRFKNFAKEIVLGNRFPRVEDNSLGWWDRVVVLNFPNSFIGKKKIPNIERRWIPDELSGILNWMLEGLYRLKENNGFTTSKTAEENKLEFIRISDPFRAWLQDCRVFLLVGEITREEAYHSYTEYCDDLGVTWVKERSFYGKLRDTPKIKPYRTTKLGKTERGFRGLTLKKSTEDNEKDPFQSEIVSEMSSMPSSTIQEYKNKKGKKENCIDKTDIPDILDINQTQSFDIDKAFPNDGTLPRCYDCKKTIHDHNKLTNLDDQFYCVSCRNKILNGRKKTKSWKCPQLGNLEGEPFCNIIQSILAKPEDCSPDCSLLQEDS